MAPKRSESPSPAPWVAMVKGRRWGKKLWEAQVGKVGIQCQTKGGDKRTGQGWMQMSGEGKVGRKMNAVQKGWEPSLKDPLLSVIFCLYL